MFALDGKTHENRKKCEKLKCFRKEGKNLAKKRKEKSGTALWFRIYKNTEKIAN